MKSPKVLQPSQLKDWWDDDNEIDTILTDRCYSYSAFLIGESGK